jgi:CheY-like chemotaxis protein
MTSKRMPRRRPGGWPPHHAGLAGVVRLCVARSQDRREGLALAEQERPDLILMDIRLPGLDGYEVTRRIKRQSGVESYPDHCGNFLCIEW